MDLILRSTSTQAHRERCQISRLYEHSPRSCKLAHQTFSRADTGDDTTARHALHDVFAVPGDEVAVVDDVFLTVL